MIDFEIVNLELSRHLSQSIVLSVPNSGSAPLTSPARRLGPDIESPKPWHGTSTPKIVLRSRAIFATAHVNPLFTHITMAAAIKALNAKIRANPYLDYFCSTRTYTRQQTRRRRSHRDEEEKDCLRAMQTWRIRDGEGEIGRWHGMGWRMQ